MVERMFVIDEFVTTQVGQAYRLLPFGPLYKGGVRREITPALAKKFRLPHFKPPIKLGSHEETTPGGGTIVGLEVREDGLYAIPELNEQGAQAIGKGDYRYHSPEIIWEGGGFEDPRTGEIIEGPLIIGDALLHMPHLGEAAALYTFEPQEVNVGDENVSVPKVWLDRVLEFFGAKASAPLEPVMQVAGEIELIKPEQLEAAVKAADEFKAKAEQAEAKLAELEAEKVRLEAEKAKSEQFGALVTRLQQKEEFGSMYIDLKSAEEAAGMLGDMTDGQREWCLRMFSAMAHQVDESKLFGEKGSAGGGAVENPQAALDAAIKAKAEEAKVSYSEAFAMVQTEKPELFVAAYGSKEKK